MLPFDDVIDFLHMAFWMESFELRNPLHWRHMGAMASRVTGTLLIVQQLLRVNKQEDNLSILPALCEGNPPVTSCSPNKRPVMWKVYYFDRNYTEIHYWGTSHFSDGLFQWRICNTGLQGIHSYLLVVSQHYTENWRSSFTPSTRAGPSLH